MDDITWNESLSFEVFSCDTDWPLKGASKEAGREEAEVTTEARLAGLTEICRAAARS